MSNKMLIDATHPEETRVVVLRGNRVEEFDFESASRKQLRGNIYLAKVTRVEPSLQAAFVDYGGNRHGFLAFSEIHPDYYQIPIADRQALLEDERRAQREDEDEAPARGERRGRSRSRHSRRGSNRNRGRDVVRSEPVEEEANAERQVEGDQLVQEDIERESAAILSGEAISAESLPEPAEAVIDSRREVEPASTDPAPQTDVTPQDLPSASPADNEAGGLPMSSGANELPGVLVESLPAEAEPAKPEMAEEPDPASSAATEEIPFASEPSEKNEDRDDEDSNCEDAEESESEESDEEDVVESVGGDAIEEVMERAPRYRRHYKIQEVIKRRQVMLVQVVKEERGTKGAALTTYLSLAGRYSVLMPNTNRGGGISRKVTNAEDRKHMKEIAEDLEVPEGMGVILRTAGAARTKIEIKRDFEYLLRLWETVRDLTLKSTAPTLVYEEGSLIKRAIRDLYHKDIDEIIVEGDGAYREAKDFMRMLMPSAVKNVVPYSDAQPVFTRYGIESQLDAMFQPTVQLKSGGYIVINQTEALVAIDVNSGRATREHSIEETATKTNIEAAAEIARQLRLRDLAGLIVIDFIDMDEGRNNRAVERKLKEALKSDRARIQVGRISHFGLMEMSRQRIRSSVLESSTEICPHCGGTGHVRAVSSVALQLVRAVEETLLKGATHNLIVRSRSDVAIYVLNHKRAHLRMLEERFRILIAVNVDPTLTGHPSFSIDRGEQVMSLDQAKAIASSIRPDSIPVYTDDDGGAGDAEVLEEVEADAAAEDDETADVQDTQERGRRKRRRGRRGRGRDGENRDAPSDAVAASSPEQNAEQSIEVDEGETDTEGAAASENGDGEKPRRRRGRRGGRRNRRGREENGEEIAAQDEGLAAPEPAEMMTRPEAVPFVTEAPQPEQPPMSRSTETQPESNGDPSGRRRSTVREAPPVFTSVDHSPPSYTPPPAPPPSAPVETTAGTETQEKPRRFGWWSRRG